MPEMQKPATDVPALAAALAAPFAADEIKWKPQSVTKDGNRALAVPYVSARAVQERLDTVLGVENWRDEYELLPCGSVVCTLSVRLAGEWISKADVGSPSEQPDEGDRVKAAFSDALKRAAVKWSIARYLYGLPKQWADYDAQKRQFTKTPTLPPSALPKVLPAPPAPDFANRLREFDERMFRAGLCQRGECVQYVQAACLKAQFPGGMNDWDPSRQAYAEAKAREFEKQRKAPVKA